MLTLGILYFRYNFTNTKHPCKGMFHYFEMKPMYDKREKDECTKIAKILFLGRIFTNIV
jgi:hypothetical protein